MTISKNDYTALLVSTSKPAHNLPQGTVLTLVHLEESESVHGSDFMMFFKTSHNGSVVNIKMSTMMLHHDCPEFFTIDDNEVHLPNQIVVQDSVDRLDEEGDKVYPQHCYNGFNEGIYNIDELKLTGLKPEITLECKTNITFEVA